MSYEDVCIPIHGMLTNYSALLYFNYLFLYEWFMITACSKTLFFLHVGFKKNKTWKENTQLFMHPRWRPNRVPLVLLYVNLNIKIKHMWRSIAWKQLRFQKLFHSFCFQGVESFTLAVDEPVFFFAEHLHFFVTDAFMGVQQWSTSNTDCSGDLQSISFSYFFQFSLLNKKKTFPLKKDLWLSLLSRKRTLYKVTKIVANAFSVDQAWSKVEKDRWKGHVIWF